MVSEKICELCLAWMLDDSFIGWLRCLCCGNMIKKGNSMISLQEMLQGNKYEDLSDELKNNAEELLRRVNLFRKEYGIPMIINSGYRTEAHNAEIGGAKNSSHCICMAIDFKDNDGKIKEFIAKDPSILDRCDLYMEDPKATSTWIHLQSRKTSSGNRIFHP